MGLEAIRDHLNALYGEEIGAATFERLTSSPAPSPPLLNLSGERGSNRSPLVRIGDGSGRGWGRETPS